MEVILRIQSKLTGRDFQKPGVSGGDELSVDDQVDMLIKEAMSVENLCELFVGWCPFW
jgi:FKBP12-rapamycin complex-associated protein